MGQITFQCDCNCAPDYMQARQCGTNADVDLWKLVSELTLPYYFKKSGVCYYFAAGNNTSDTPGTILAGETPTANCSVCNYIQAKRCSDNSDADYWRLKTEVSLPYYFKKYEICYYFAEGNNESTTPGTILAGEDAIADCHPCDYIQAKKCIDGSLVDLWRLVSAGVPYYFLKSGVCYKIEDGNPTSDTPGTLLTGETSKASCEECQPCGFCTATPYQYNVALSGITLCPCSNCVPFGTSTGITGDTTGIFTVTRTSETGCVWQGDFTGFVTETEYTATTTCTGATGTIRPKMRIRLTRVSGSWQLQVETRKSDGTSPGRSLFDETASAATCTSAASFTGSRTSASCGCSGSGAYGGSASIAPV